ncbi:DNA repair protein rhp41 [Nannizzia gypsea CBS 118893]|uniref:DNA repair protein rhp41 n=1 Tax=Arthroderma gypseum (strain ATCC MYA-4604 / CBS 118893) TaxID=535722 RepID=E5R0U9_ARTGP|nr:DNA repair protein rhp41 [Nannizzia gypsea CBS 118893]EFQ98391.1 DNA repair protein rhp41 [Nannizzia gypsea CBS 118893]
MAKKGSSPATRRSRRGGLRRRISSSGSPANGNDDIPEIYQDMLNESQAAPQALPHRNNPPHKRRRVGERGEIEAAEVVTKSEEEKEKTTAMPPQTVYDVDASEEESEPEWEDVSPPGPSTTPSLPSMLPAGHDIEQEPLQITLGKEEDSGKKGAAIRRKPVTGAEKKLRLEIHKVHILCLLGHVRLRNTWCNDEETHKKLRRILSKHIIMCLNPKEDLPQFTRSTTFVDGLLHSSEAFRRRFKVTGPGMRKPYWLEDCSAAQDPIALQGITEILQSRIDFRKHAEIMQGSRDFGAQLFCAMLRGVGVDTRLVCSLQTLPFTGVAKGESSKKRTRDYILVSEDDAPSSSVNAAANVSTSDTTPRRRIGQPQFTSKHIKSPAPQTRDDVPAPDSLFPVFWVEVFNHAMQKWVCVDPLVTNTVGKPALFEPPASDNYNNMNYVIAFNEDGFARDVTRRYTKSFNSKTRKARIESTKDGEKWWNRTMQALELPFPEDRDQLEFGELTAKAASEGMPKSVQDFKNHPVYALEQHLRWNEVIYPKREIGKVGLSKLSLNKKAPPLESVYRRTDVHSVKSADGWYRQGRKVKAGEQPLKRVRARGQVRQHMSNSDDEGHDTPMYAAYQTELYVPEPVIDGKVPRNEFGNIDVYIPSMVPQGGFHLRHPDAAEAAKILRIDYADAVVGFKFKKRHGTAVIDGIVAATEYRDALEAIILGIGYERQQTEETRRTMAALHMWKLFLIKLRVLERVNSYRTDGVSGREDLLQEVHGAEEQAGGFLPEDDYVVPALPTANNAIGEPYALHESVEGSRSIQEDIGGGFMVEPETSQPAFPGDIANRPLQRREPVPSASQSRYTLVVVPKEEQAWREPSIISTGLGQQDTMESRSSQPADGTRSASVTVDSPEREVSGLPELVHVDSDSDIDRSSMISHDPEDDNAEPEWLLSD